MQNADQPEPTTSFVENYLRRGVEADLGARPSARGYFAPAKLDQMIEAAVSRLSPFRSIANVVRTGSAGYRKLASEGPAFEEITPSYGDLYANPAASQAMLDDASFNLEAWLAEEIAGAFVDGETPAFVNGNGTNKPKGFIAYPMTDQPDAVRPLGTLQYIASGAAGDFTASPQNRLIALVQALNSAYRQGAVFVMNSATLSRVRKFKTEDGAFLWQPSLVVGAPATLLGYPVIEAEDMPDIAHGSLSIAFGNFAHGYVIAERSETSIWRDPFTSKPFVHFFAVKRVGGAVANSNAIKVMKFAEE